MRDAKRLVLDADILLRGVFGVRVLALLEAYEDIAAFYSPDVCFPMLGSTSPRSQRGAVSMLLLD